MRAASLRYVTLDRSAAAGLDYVASAGELIFLPGETNQAIPLTLLADSLDESNETFSVIFSHPENLLLPTNTLTVTIVDSDRLPSISLNDIAIAEGDAGLTPAAFAVRLSPVSGKEVRVNFATAGGGAVSPSDYIATNGTLIFPPGTTNQQVNLFVHGDVTNELNETVFLNLSVPVNAILADAQGVATILDDDPLPTIESITVTGNTVTVRWRSQPGANYRVQYRPVLDAGSWLDLPGDVMATGDMAARSDTLTGAHRFYRVVLLP